MKVSVMEVGPTMYDLIEAFNHWMEDSSRVDYKFTEEQQYYLQQMIKIMNNQIDMLIDYEQKRNNN